MYSEKSYKNHIFWIKVKRFIVVLILGCLGAALGVLIGKILESTVQLTSFNNLIIAISTTVFFLLGLLLTAGTAKQVQDGYWRIAVLRKLTVIQKNIELNNELLKNVNKTENKKLPSNNKKVIEVKAEEIKEEEVTAEEIAEVEEVEEVEEKKEEKTPILKFEKTALGKPNNKNFSNKKMKKKKMKKVENAN